ncbi:hypothetical protein Tco_1111622 [Tanacetum coccineum]|uniref:Uncharacterized protein n=1 Tax=Tanacetum coccineum TaxID=301880 RepID=A0ABQ5IM55_9ASTR
MTLAIHNWSSTAHQELHKIVKDEIFPIVNQVYTRVQNFKIQFLKEAAKFVRDFRSLAKDADESLAKHKALDYEIDRLLRAVVKKLETCIIIKEKEYPVLWNNWYKKCEECKYDKISYDKAYKDMQNKLKRLQAQLGDLKGKSSNTQCASNTLDPLSQKLEDENDFAAALAVLITEASQSRQHDTLVKLPMDIRLKIDLENQSMALLVPLVKSVCAKALVERGGLGFEPSNRNREDCQGGILVLAASGVGLRVLGKRVRESDGFGV